MPYSKLLKINEKKMKILVASLVILGAIFLMFGEFAGAASSNFLFEQGNKYFGEEKHNLGAAEKFYKAALFLNTKAKGPHYQLARIEFLKGNFQDALDEIDKEIENHPGFKRSYYVRGLINGYAKNYEAAVADFKEFLAWDKRSWAAHNDLAWVYFSMGDYKNVKETAEDGLKYSQDNPWLLNSYGLALLNLKEKEKAREVFGKALPLAEKLTPKDWQKAYPGNDPGIAEEGLHTMVASIERNQKLADSGR